MSDNTTGDDHCHTTENTTCHNCHMMFTDVRQLLGHSSVCGAVAMTTEYDDDDDDVDDDAYRSSNDSSEPEMGCRKPEAGVDRCARGESRWRTETGSDDEYAADFRYGRSLNEKTCEIGNTTTADREHQPVDDGDVFHRSSEQNTSPYNLSSRDRRSSSDGSSVAAAALEEPHKMSAADGNRLLTFDNNVSPTTKIAMLESAIYGLHRQQMIQLELIESLRRQLAAAVAARADSAAVTSPTSSLPFSSLDLVAPRSGQTPSSSSFLQKAASSGLTSPDVVGAASDAAAAAFAGNGNSSLSSLMRLSASVDRQAQQHCRVASSPGTREPSEPESRWQPTLQSRGETDSQLSGKKLDDVDSNKSRDLTAGAKLSVPPPGGLSDLSLFKKGIFVLHCYDSLLYNNNRKLHAIVT